MVDRQPLLFMNGLALAALGLLMLLPALVDALANASDARVFLASAGATLAVGGFFITASGGFGPRLNRKTGFLITTSVWITVSLFAALPFAFGALPLSYVDGVFEAVSGLTTTGATTIARLDDAPKGMLLWRALLNWMGGMGIIGMAIVLLPFLQVGGMQLFRTESSDRSDKVLPGTRQTALAMITVYLSLDVACALAYWFGGMGAFDAICHAMATISTGGFSTHDASFAYFHSRFIFWSATIFMFLGALPFVLFIRLARGEFHLLWRDTQVVALASVVLIASLAIAIYIIAPNRPWTTAVPDSIFNVVSIVTTTGFASTDYSAWGPFPMLVFLMLAFHGGCTGSTAGGIKTMRVQVLVRQAFVQVRRILLPHAVMPMRYGGRAIAPELASSVSTFALLYIITVFAVAFGLGLTGLDLFPALTASAAAVGNVGPAFGDILGHGQSYAGLSDLAKIILASGMLAGRLEFLTVIVLLTKTFWRS